MLPTFSQYRKWSLPAKYGFWGVVFGAIPIGISIHDWILAVPDYATIALNYGTSEMTIFGAAGESIETAIVVRGANSHEAGINAEYYWISRRFPGYKSVSQTLVEGTVQETNVSPVNIKDAATGIQIEAVQPNPLPPRKYDAITIRNWLWRERTIYFDATSFWARKSEPRESGMSWEKANDLTKQRLKNAIDANQRDATRNQ